MNRRSLLTSLIGVFGLASTAKAEDTIEIAKVATERNDEPIHPLEVLESAELLPTHNGILVNGIEERVGYNIVVLMNGKQVGRCQAANAKEGWVEVLTNAAKTTSCGAFDIEATSTEDKLIRTRVYGNFLILGGSYKSFQCLDINVAKALTQHAQNYRKPFRIVE